MPLLTHSRSINRKQGAFIKHLKHSPAANVYMCALAREQRGVSFLLQGNGVKTVSECVWAGAAGPTDL